MHRLHANTTPFYVADWILVSTGLGAGGGGRAVSGANLSGIGGTTVQKWVTIKWQS